MRTIWGGGTCGANAGTEKKERSTARGVKFTNSKSKKIYYFLCATKTCWGKTKALSQAGRKGRTIGRASNLSPRTSHTEKNINGQRH